jgi:transcription elongation factor Elf1
MARNNMDELRELPKCPKCGSDNHRIISIVYGADGKADSLRCNDCGQRFEDTGRYAHENALMSEDE